ncbi:MAG: hypothetical protein JXB49_12305 [Bacteroidales bacterium]|nr:hypothetical protein [Bacteroidales bacterium]
MNDQLEKFILDNRDEFDVYDPSPDVWNRIEKDLHKKKQFSLKTVLWRAAAVVVIFMLSYVAHDFIGRDKTKVTERQGTELENYVDKIPELAEAKAYYTKQVNSKLEEIKPMLDSNPGLSDDIMKDLSELDSIYNNLKKDLLDNIANQEIVEAMIQNYRLKLEILEELQMELLNDEKNDDYETSNRYEI